MRSRYPLGIFSDSYSRPECVEDPHQIYGPSTLLGLWRLPALTSSSRSGRADGYFNGRFPAEEVDFCGASSESYHTGGVSDAPELPRKTGKGRTVRQSSLDTLYADSGSTCDFQ